MRCSSFSICISTIGGITPQNCGPLVRNVSFTLRRGEILGFAGLMGAGRTEVARAIFGADKLESGDIIVRGIAASIKSPANAVALGIGYLSEDRKRFGLAVGMDVESNVVMATLARHLKFKFVLRRQAVLLDPCAGSSHLCKLSGVNPARYFAYALEWPIIRLRAEPKYCGVARDYSVQRSVDWELVIL